MSQAKVGRRYTDDECYKNQLIVWTHFGRPPTYRGMGYPPLVVGGSAYRRRFGTWNRALAAFVERVNSDDKIEEVGDDQPRASFSDPAIQPKTQEDRRDVPLGLRFKVLKRDHFKCVLCGDHPARNSECVLHVDHILPWSLGGKTIEENLTTLCETCNLGRGNRYRD